MLSSLREDYSIDMLSDTQIIRASNWISRNSNSKSKRICVIDAMPWLHTFEENFKTLDISFLRSPALAHCSYFDRNALLAYAVSTGRENELLDSGCSDIKSLKGTSMPHNGSWKLPSTSLFIDFSRSYAQSLRHDFIQGMVLDIQKAKGSSSFKITVSDKTKSILSCTSVILATGAVGRPVIPKSLADVSPSRIFQWKQLDQVLPCLDQSKAMEKRILVIGGGLTAVQTAHKLVRSSRAESPVHVTLCSRRPLVERHFDIPVKWFDFREAHVYQSQFYHEPAEERLQALRTTRGGGTVPPIYMKTTRKMQERGELDCIVGDLKVIKENDDKSFLLQFFDENGKDIKNSTFDAIVLACGLRPDCLGNPLIQKIHKQWPVEIFGGLPNISEDLRWTDNLYVVGGLASLSVGPDANNLMGIARAAETVSNNMDSKQWLRQEESNVLKNPFDLLLDDTDYSSDEDDY